MLRTLLGTNLWIEQNARQAFNLDTILLQSFVRVPRNTKRIVDIGTGAGPLMLYLATKSKANILGIEIQEERYQQALKNIERNDLSHRLSVIHQDVKRWEAKDIDLIVSNPPFFKVGEDSYINDNEEDTIARHEVMLNLNDLLQVVSKSLKYGGLFFMIHRPERFAEIVSLGEKYQLIVKRVRFVHPYQHAKANHILVEMMKNGNPGMLVENPLILYYEKHILTKEMVEIYGGNSHVIKPIKP